MALGRDDAGQRERGRKGGREGGRGGREQSAVHSPFDCKGARPVQSGRSPTEIWGESQRRRLSINSSLFLSLSLYLVITRRLAPLEH